MKIDLKKSIEIWNKNVEKFGDSIKALAYGSQKTQYKKFQILTEIGDLNGKTILDVGCGFGDLWQFLKLKGVKVKFFHGVDIAPKMIEIGKKKYPNLKLEVIDIFKTKWKNKYDYVLSTGFNCYKTGNNEILEKEMLKKMFEICKIGVAAGFQSCYSPTYNPDSDNYYSNPTELFKFCKTITKWVVLRHEYMPHDFTLYLFKQSPYD